MILRKQGKIINCASIAAHSGFSMLAAYSASKFAVRGFTQALAKELGQYNIQVNAYCPGIVGTDMWDFIDEKLGPILGNKRGETLKQYTKLITWWHRHGVNHAHNLGFEELVNHKEQNIKIIVSPN